MIHEDYIYVLTCGVFTAVCEDEELAKAAAKKIAVEQGCLFTARIEKHSINRWSDGVIIYHEQMQGAT